MKKPLFLALLAIVWLAAPVRAVEPGARVKTQNEGVSQPKVQLKTQNRENVEAKCQLAESKIQFRINQYEQSRDKHYQIFQGVRKRIATLASSYETRGCDVAIIKEDLVKFDSLIQDFAAGFRDFKTSMVATKNARCTSNEPAAYAKSVQSSRQKSLNMRSQSEAVKNFFASTIKPHLSQKIKECRPTPTPSIQPASSEQQ